MHAILTDLRFALRTLRRTPGFTLAVVLTLALGIGANTAIFSVVDGVLLRPAPVRDIDRLVMVWETDRKSGTVREPASIPDWFDFGARSRQVTAPAAFMPFEVNLTTAGGEPQRIAALVASAGLLPTLGLQPALGRGFTAEEDQAGAPRVALISDAMWARQFGRDPGALGRSIVLNDVSHTIVGIMPPAGDFGMLQVLGAANYGRGFADRGGRPRVDVWLPLRTSPAAAMTASRDNHPIFVLARLAPGAGVRTAQDELGAIAADLERAWPSNAARGVHVEALSAVVFGPVRPALLVLLGAVALVLLVACVNVINLLLARGEAREREVTVRLALGASARRLARQFFVESAVLVLAGAAVGVLTASFGLDLLLALAPATLPRVDAVGIDARVLAATLAMSVLAAAVFGILPARQAWRRDLHTAMQAEGRGTAGREAQRFRASLVVAELALAVMLMAGAGLLIRSLWRLQQVNPGFNVAGVVKADFQLPPSRYPQNFNAWPRWTEVRQFADAVRRDVAALPGVEAVSVVGAQPLEAGFTSSIRVTGREADARDWPEPSIRLVDAGYFDAVQLPLVAGRLLSFNDDAGAPPVVLINEAARRRFFSGYEPLGQQVQLWGSARTVVGVVGDEHFHGLAAASAPAVYLPAGQAPVTGGSILVRTHGDATQAMAALRRVVRQLDPALPLFGVEPLAKTLTDSLGQRRFTMLVLGAFAAVALLLAVIGVHGVLSYTVSRRTREIGIRMALGADRRRVQSLVLSQGARLAALGLGIGLVGALALTRTLTTLLYGIGAADPATYAAITLLLGAVAMLACWLPARRAMRTDPLIAIRSE